MAMRAIVFSNVPNFVAGTPSVTAPALLYLLHPCSRPNLPLEKGEGLTPSAMSFVQGAL
jgi:hypothetical protein